MNIADMMETMAYGPSPESAQEARAWLAAREGSFGHFINGQFTAPGEDGFDTVNPANGSPLARVTQATQADVDAAVAAARAAFPAWSALSGHARARYLYALARQVQKHSRLLAVLETLDNGKPVRETRDIDVPLVARHFYYHAGWAQLLESEFPGAQPLGVAGQIIPWNFPLLMLSWKIAPALAAGNTVVLKPAEFTPLTALYFAELCQEVGLPPGVVNIVTGDGRVGEMIVQHEYVNKIAFTGSTEVGRRIRRATAGTGKALTLELGGKSPFIVFDDADIDSAIEGVVDAIWFNQGQVCCAGSRLLVQEGIADDFYRRLRERMEKLRVGDPLDKVIDIGAIIAPVQLERIERLVAQGVAEGADMWQPSWAVPAEGYFYPPTLFTSVSPASTVAQVEIFGPVLVGMTFRTPADAVDLANNTRYGLAASVWTENINLALDVAAKVKAGTVWVNSTNMFDAAAGFGGFRESGFGREGGKEGMWQYLRTPDEAAVDASVAGGAVASGSAGAGAGAGAAAAGSPLPPIDRTPKMYIGGKQARPDAQHTHHVLGPDGAVVGEVGLGNRKDIRNAVEAAHAAAGKWAGATAALRSQILYYVAENLGARGAEFAGRLQTVAGYSAADAAAEVEASLDRLFAFAAWADRYDGQVHRTPARQVTIAMPEPLGVIGIACPDERPLLGFVTLVAAALSVGNAVVAVPSERYPLLATDLYQVLDTSDVPGGAVNIVTGRRDELAKVLADHDDVDGVWYVGGTDGASAVEEASAGNVKRTWVHAGPPLEWTAPSVASRLLREATQVKNIWVPYGE